MKKAHIIHHTHWDREWFLTYIYTTSWVPKLISELERIIEKNPNFRYLMDGQTLIVRDVYERLPEYKDRLEKLINEGNLLIGPYFCQPDWHIPQGESLYRNLMYGVSDMKKYGVENYTGWMVDIFGHISQEPQIHRQFGIDHMYLWRGVRSPKPYFNWQSPDGSEVLGINLIGGYRNLYGSAKFPDVAFQRLKIEMDKLSTYYPTDDIPLFDGYDLEFQPEDTAFFYEQYKDELNKTNIEFAAQTPVGFFEEIRSKLSNLELIQGEMNSGKYGGIFNGVTSSRTYLKILNSDIENLIYRYAEPLSLIAERSGRKIDFEKYEDNIRELLTNNVHDAICGVSIDQVHERMEYSYNKLFAYFVNEIEQSISYVASNLVKGVYVFTPYSFRNRVYERFSDKIAEISVDSLGINKIENIESVETKEEIIEDFVYDNGHYNLKVRTDGHVLIDEMRLGFVTFRVDKGDAYTSEPSSDPIILKPTSQIKLIEESVFHKTLAYSSKHEVLGREIMFEVKIIFDNSKIIKWDIDLLTKGVDFLIEVVFDTKIRSGEVFAGSQFDVVRRDFVDEDLFSINLPEELKKVLLAQREMVYVKRFPFHDFVTLFDGEKSYVALAQGNREYEATEDGQIRIALTRSTGLMSRPLEFRIGDAASEMYVPDGRSERKVSHKIAFAIVDGHPESIDVQRINAAFQYKPLIFEVESLGKISKIDLLKEEVAVSSISRFGSTNFIRVYNSTKKEITYTEEKSLLSPMLVVLDKVRSIKPKEIQTLEFELDIELNDSSQSKIVIVNTFQLRVGENLSKPDMEVIKKMEKNIKDAQEEKTKLEMELPNLTGREYHLAKHRLYIVSRYITELRLSIILNDRKQNKTNLERYLFEIDDEVMEIGTELNNLRVYRRIYDYVAAMFK